jgi:uncharacterized membrane protein
MGLVLYGEYMAMALLGVIMMSVAIIAIIAIVMMLVVRIIRFRCEEREMYIEKKLELEEYLRKHRGV